MGTPEALIIYLNTHCSLNTLFLKILCKRNVIIKVFEYINFTVYLFFLKCFNGENQYITCIYKYKYILIKKIPKCLGIICGNFDMLKYIRISVHVPSSLLHVQ